MLSFKDYNRLFLEPTKLLSWSGQGTVLILILQKTYGVLKDKVADKHLSNIPTLIKAIKLVWIHEIPKEF